MRAIGEALLDAWPRLRRRPSAHADVCTLAGPFGFELAPPGLPAISDTYQLRLEIPLGAPDKLLGVFEEGGRLRKDPDEHINSDGSFCLGSPLRLRLLMRESVGLIAFLERCLVPFLYAATWRSLGNDGYPFRELPHYGPGLIEDYGALLGIQGHRPIAIALALLSARRRVANKRACACGSSKRLGTCRCHHRLNALRVLAPCSFWRRTLLEYLRQNPLPEVPARPKRARKLRCWQRSRASELSGK
jgi:hypothetical protein